jgi:UDP-2,3-diacylglucosamine hydrolase
MSRFLPEGWNLSEPIALLAGQGGKGSYPYLLAQAARKAGVPLRLVALKGETDPELGALFGAEEVCKIAIGEIGGLLNALKKMGARGLIMAGRVTPAHAFTEIFPDLKAIALMASLKERNAETIFGAVAGEVEKVGVSVLDARAFMDENMASAGVMVKGRENVPQEAIAHGVRIEEALAGLDVGQSVVVRKGTVLAVEAFEGTDAMLERAGAFKTDGKIFVKGVKARQNWKFDVPIFGLTTLERCAASSIKTVALKSDGVIMVGKAEILKRAKELGVTLLGF